MHSGSGLKQTGAIQSQLLLAQARPTLMKSSSLGDSCVCVCSKSWTWFMISDHYRLQMPWNLQFFLPFLLLCNIYLLPNQKVMFRCAVFPVLHTISKQLQGSPLHSRLRAIGGDPFRLFGVVNFASHFICFQISALPLILSASKNPSYNFRG